MKRKVACARNQRHARTLCLRQRSLSLVQSTFMASQHMSGKALSPCTLNLFLDVGGKGVCICCSCHLGHLDGQGRRSDISRKLFIRRREPLAVTAPNKGLFRDDIAHEGSNLRRVCYKGWSICTGNGRACARHSKDANTIEV